MLTGKGFTMYSLADKGRDQFGANRKKGDSVLVDDANIQLENITKKNWARGTVHTRTKVSSLGERKSSAYKGAAHLPPKMTDGKAIPLTPDIQTFRNQPNQGPFESCWEK